MEILSIDYPIIRIGFSGEKTIEFNFMEFLNEIAPDEHNPYRKILEPEVFRKAYVENDKLIWEDVLELQMCGGDTMWMPAEFTKDEILSFLKAIEIRTAPTGHSE